MIKNKGIYKYIAVLVAVMLLLSIIFTTAGGIIPSSKAEAVQKQTTFEDQRVAEELSNMSGVEVKTLLKLKDQGKSWNEITELIKNGSVMSDANETDRSSLLAQNNLSEEYINELKKEGYADKQITEASMLAEHIIYQLNEIAMTEAQLTQAPEILLTEAEKTGSSNDDEAYKELASKINLKTAVTLMLKLEKEFVSIEKVLDEYLYTLQLGINLELYLTDKKAYEEQRKEKSAGIDPQKVITAAKIDEKLLEKIQQQSLNNTNQTVPDAVQPPGVQNITGTSTNNYDSLTQEPEIGNINPPKPEDEINKEINELINKSMGIVEPQNEGGNQ